MYENCPNCTLPLSVFNKPVTLFSVIPHGLIESFDILDEKVQEELEQHFIHSVCTKCGFIQGVSP